MSDTFGLKGHTIKVFSGGYINLKDPDPRDINIKSIACGLSNICRFGGQCSTFYSVAEHCLNAVDFAKEDGVDRATLKAILLHDAAEAYIGDIVKPLKVLLPEYGAIESRFNQAIEEAFGFEFADFEPSIKEYDRLALVSEKVWLFPQDREVWQGFKGLEPRDLKHYGGETTDAVFLTFLDTWRPLNDH